MVDSLQRLAALPALSHIPRSELEWLSKHGSKVYYKQGLFASKGDKIEYLWIIVEGHISVRIDRGAGPKVANTELYAGSITGMLPYSRMKGLPGNAYADEDSEVFSISTKYFTEMITECPTFTAHTVHSMIDRTRIHNTSAMSDEKMISMGKLAAGLAHELNNPASAALRDAKLLEENQDAADNTFRILNKTGISDEQFNEIEHLRKKCSCSSNELNMSPLQKADLQDDIANWLDGNQLDTYYADQLAFAEITTDDLCKLKSALPDNAFEPALQWIIARTNLQNLAVEINQSTNQIFKLVDSVKKFTHMDNLAERELVDVKSGIKNTIKLLDAKSKSKKAQVLFDAEDIISGVFANGAMLGQVWFSLLDNALDAIPEAGKIQICAKQESDFIVVQIIDNGPGISLDKIDKVFDPFFTTKPPGQGTGLGLDLSRRIIRSYNGELSVRSEPGKTEFSVKFNTNRN